MVNRGGLVAQREQSFTWIGMEAFRILKDLARASGRVVAIAPATGWALRRPHRPARWPSRWRLAPGLRKPGRTPFGVITRGVLIFAPMLLAIGQVIDPP